MVTVSMLPIHTDRKALEFIIDEAQASMRAAGLPVPAMFIGQDEKTLIIRSPKEAEEIEGYEGFISIAWQIGLFVLSQEMGDNTDA